MGKGIAVLFKKKFGGVDEILTQGNNNYKVNNLYNFYDYCISPMETCFINPLVTVRAQSCSKMKYQRRNLC